MDNYEVSELIDVSVAAVLVDEDQAAVPMMIVPRDVVIIAATTARIRSPTTEHERSDCQGGEY